MIIFVLCFVYAFIGVSVAKNDNYTFTYATAMRCSEHISQHGYLYETFYRIDESTLQHTKLRKNESNSAYFEMHIAVQAASNGHILLSSTAYPKLTDPVYEIVIGGGANKFTELRLNQKTNARSSAKTPGILSTVEFTAFYIRISEDGLIEFGKEGDSLPLLSYYDAHTMPVKYFSFASWSGVEAKFLFDCPSPDDMESGPKSQAVEPKLSNSDELKRTLLMSRLPSLAPESTVTVKLNIRITKVKYDALTTELTTDMAVVMSWIDDSMAWNPNKFNGTTNLKFRQGQIWRPMFFVLNSVGTDAFDTINPDMISMVNSGEATFHFQTQIKTWCIGDSDLEHNKWPHDEHSCPIVIEPWEVHEKILMEIMDEKDRKLQVLADIDKPFPSEWEAYKIHEIISADLWNTVYESYDNATHQSDRLIYNIGLRRIATTYNIVFYTPLLVLVTFILMSFWSDPLDPFKESFYAGCVIIICMLLSGIDKLVPTHTVPSILVIYVSVMYGVLIALIVHVFLTSPRAGPFCKTKVMQAIFTFRLFRIVYFLPPVKISINGSYFPQEDEEEPTTSDNMEEMERDEKKPYGDPKELAEVLDKTMFVVYTITFASLMAAHY